MNCEEKDFIESLKGHYQGQKGQVWLIFTYFSILISSNVLKCCPNVLHHAASQG